ncbi:hypothetical protein PCE1_001903 [Barthelona sp. PCE]
MNGKRAEKLLQLSIDDNVVNTFNLLQNIDGVKKMSRRDVRNRVRGVIVKNAVKINTQLRNTFMEFSLLRKHIQDTLDECQRIHGKLILLPQKLSSLRDSWKKLTKDISTSESELNSLNEKIRSITIKPESVEILIGQSVDLRYITEFERLQTIIANAQQMTNIELFSSIIFETLDELAQLRKQCLDTILRHATQRFLEKSIVDILLRTTIDSDLLLLEFFILMDGEFYSEQLLSCIFTNLFGEYFEVSTPDEFFMMMHTLYIQIRRLFENLDAESAHETLHRFIKYRDINKYIKRIFDFFVQHLVERFKLISAIFARYIAEDSTDMVSVLNCINFCLFYTATFREISPEFFNLVLQELNGTMQLFEHRFRVFTNACIETEPITVATIFSERSVLFLDQYKRMVRIYTGEWLTGDEHKVQFNAFEDILMDNVEAMMSSILIEKTLISIAYSLRFADVVAEHTPDEGLDGFWGGFQSFVDHLCTTFASLLTEKILSRSLLAIYVTLSGEEKCDRPSISDEARALDRFCAQVQSEAISLKEVNLIPREHRMTVVYCTVELLVECYECVISDIQKQTASELMKEAQDPTAPAELRVLATSMGKDERLCKYHEEKNGRVFWTVLNVRNALNELVKHFQSQNQ